MLISFIHTLHDAALNLFCVWDRHLYSGFSGHLILKEEFPAIFGKNYNMLYLYVEAVIF